jgi:hypothetical protein
MNEDCSARRQQLRRNAWFATCNVRRARDKHKKLTDTRLQNPHVVCVLGGWQLFEGGPNVGSIELRQMEEVRGRDGSYCRS